MYKNWILFWSLGFSGLTLPVFAGVKVGNFLGANGINALKLHQAPYNLTGRKIAIGQVEIGRPGMFGWDKAVSKNRAVSPFAVFSRNVPAKSNVGVDPHAYNVSGVMVSHNVAFSSEREGIFNKVHVSNLASINQGIENRLAGKEFNIGGRSAINIVAPGTNIPLINPDGKLNKSTGTSFAAPQVTATVALLQEFVDRQLRTKQANWTIDARRHQVMKAILLNSADKIKDSGDGLRLGMTRTLIDKQNQDWLATDAYKNPKIPLDAQMGAGHLNAFRAYQQLNGGEWKPNATVPPIGWDYGIVMLMLILLGNMLCKKV
jgi:subtilisin family serine protease